MSMLPLQSVHKIFIFSIKGTMVSRSNKPSFQVDRLLPICIAFLLGMVFLWALQNGHRLRPMVPRSGSHTSPTSTAQQTECVVSEATPSCTCPVGTNGTGCLIVNRFGTLQLIDLRAVDGGLGLQLIDNKQAFVGGYGLSVNGWSPGETPVLTNQFSTTVSRIRKLDEVTYLVTLRNPNYLNVQGLPGANYLRFLRISFSPLKIEPFTERDVIGLFSYHGDDEYPDYVFDTGSDVNNPRFILSRLNSPESKQEPSGNLQAIADITDQLRAVGLLSRLSRDESMGIHIDPEDESNKSFILRYSYFGIGNINDLYRIDLSSSTNPVITQLKNIEQSKR